MEKYNILLLMSLLCGQLKNYDGLGVKLYMGTRRNDKIII